MSVLRIRGYALPDGEPIDLYADDDRWTDDPVPGAETVAQGWILPGLVDMHTHPGALAAAGLTPHAAIAAGSWAARSFLGLGGLVPGAPADAVIYDTDPRTDLAQLDSPRAVILRGRPAALVS